MTSLLQSDHKSLNDKYLINIYESSFPKDERRNWDEIIELVKTEKIIFYSIVNNNSTIGFLTSWSFADFLFIEHFVIDEKERNKGFGNAAIEKIIAQTKKTIILETEENTDTTSAKRIKFYQKIGFEINEFEYLQAPYSGNSKFIKMHLLSHPRKITKKDFIRFKQLIYKDVYNYIEE